MTAPTCTRLALSIRQPYAELIFRGIKKVEYRSSGTRVRGRVYVYASLGAGDSRDFARMGLEPGSLPVGKIVGTVVDRVSGEDVVLDLEALTAANARAKAEIRGLVVTAVDLVDTPAKFAAKTLEGTVPSRQKEPAEQAGLLECLN